MKKVLSIIIVTLIVFLIGCNNKKDIIICSDVIEIGDIVELKHSLLIEDVIWESSDFSIATIIDNKLYAKTVGEVIITLISNGKEFNKKINIVRGNFDYEIDGFDVLFLDSSIKFNIISEKEIKEKPIWSSSDDSVATIDKDGNVFGKKTGSALVYANLFGIEKSYEITVFDSKFDFFISAKNVLAIGEVEKVDVMTNFSGEIVFSSSDESIASISEDGVITPIKEGKVVISATLFNKTEHLEVEIINDYEKIRIDGKDIIRLDEETILKCNYDVIWSTSDPEIADIFPDGEIYPNSIGTVIIKAVDKNNENNFTTLTLTIIGKTPKKIKILGDDIVSVEKSIKLDVETTPFDASKRVRFISNNPFVAEVNEEGVVFGIRVGKAIISAISVENDEIIATHEVEVVLKAPDKITINGRKEMKQGEHNYLNVHIEGENVCQDIVWSSSDNSIAIVDNGIVLGVNIGKVKIYAYSLIDDSVCDYIEINIERYQNTNINSEDLKKANEILSKMTIEQKIGQMFVVGFSGMQVTNDLEKTIKDYHMGNVIYMGYNVSDYSSIGSLSNNIQKLMIKNNKVAGFITIDQEGGRVARLTKGGTHFISNMAMGATGNYENTFYEGKAIGEELRNYGINVDFAPVLDVNNNPENPIIGIRSYSDNPLDVSLYGKNMFLGLAESNVMGCAKHFPGHGNTSVDSHLGLPMITTPIEKLYQTELAPFISAISNGIDSIMTTHIVFSAIDKQFPATLSEKVLTDLLRYELGYEGLIITDGMEMDAVSKNFGDYDETAVLAIKAGADILTYTTTKNPIKAYNGIKKAIENKEITEERIDDSVRRILLKKIKYGLLDDYLAKDTDISVMLESNEELNLKFACDSLTLVKGNFSGLEKNKKTLIISPTTSFDLGNELGNNSFANYASNYLNSFGHNSDCLTVNNKLTSNDLQQLLNKCNEYEQIVLAFSNVKTTNLIQTANFVKQVSKLKQAGKEVVVIALDTPYDLMSYGEIVDNYICVYGYQKASVIALSKFLNGEFKAIGKLSVSEENFK